MTDAAQDQEIPEEDLSALTGHEIIKTGRKITVKWPGRNLVFLFSGLSESGQGVKSEVIIAHYLLGRIHWGQLVLTSQAANDTLSKKLSKIIPLSEENAWPNLIEKTFYETVKSFRQGEPVVTLKASTQSENEDFAIYPLMPKNEVTFIYADGGSGKSYLSLFLAMSYSAGLELPYGIKPIQPGKAMILDWEAGQRKTEYRLTQICTGLGLPFPEIAYRRMVRPLDDDIESIRQEVIDRKISFLIVDSWQPACGSSDGDPSSRTVSTISAIRSLEVSCLAIAHLSKSEATGGTSQNRIYGSVFAWNLARSIWELRKNQSTDTESICLGLFHKKCNDGRLRQELGFRMCFDSGAVKLYATDLSNEPEIMRAATQPTRILNELRQGAMTSREIADSTGLTENSVRSNLTRLKREGKVISIGEGKKDHPWGLKS